MRAIRYGSDECNSEENLRWMNDLADEGEAFVQVILFKSDWRSPEGSYLAGGCDTATEYTDWEWWLAREDGGEWKLVTWGY